MADNVFDEIIGKCSNDLCPYPEPDFDKITLEDMYTIMAISAGYQDSQTLAPSHMLALTQIFNRTIEIDLFSLPYDDANRILDYIAQRYVEWVKDKTQSKG